MTLRKHTTRTHTRTRMHTSTFLRYVGFKLHCFILTYEEPKIIGLTHGPLAEQTEGKHREVTIYAHALHCRTVDDPSISIDVSRLLTAKRVAGVESSETRDRGRSIKKPR